MALNIDIVNSTVINVYETDEIPRSYFGATGASGRFYPSGTSGAIVNMGWTILSNTIADALDGEYEDVPSTSNSTSGTPSVLFFVEIIDGIAYAQINGIVSSFGSGYAIGDIFTIQGSSVGGSGELVLRITELDIDGLLIVIGGDSYEVKWNNLVVGGTSPTSLSDAQSSLATLFSTLQ